MQLYTAEVCHATNHGVDSVGVRGALIVLCDAHIFVCGAGNFACTNPVSPDTRRSRWS